MKYAAVTKRYDIIRKATVRNVPTSALCLRPTTSKAIELALREPTATPKIVRNIINCHTLLTKLKLKMVPAETNIDIIIVIRLPYKSMRYPAKGPVKPHPINNAEFAKLPIHALSQTNSYSVTMEYVLSLVNIHSLLFNLHFSLNISLDCGIFSPKWFLQNTELLLLIQVHGGSFAIKYNIKVCERMGA